MYTFDDYKKKIFKLRLKIFKITLILGVVFSLLATVFGLYGSIKLPKYDSNEYMLFATVKTYSTLSKEECPTPDRVRLRLTSLGETLELLVVFTEHPSFNKDTHNIAIIIRDMSKELTARYAAGNPSVIYCKLKFNNIIEATSKIMEILGNRRPSNGII